MIELFYTLRQERLQVRRESCEIWHRVCKFGVNSVTWFAMEARGMEAKGLSGNNDMGGVRSGPEDTGGDS